MAKNLILYVDASALHHNGGGATHLYYFLKNNNFDDFVQVKIFGNYKLIETLPKNKKFVFVSNYFINSGLLYRVLWSLLYFNPMIFFKRNVIILNLSCNIIFHPNTYTVSHNLLPFDNDFIKSTDFKARSKFKIQRYYQTSSFYFSKRVIFVSQTLQQFVGRYYGSIYRKSVIIYNSTDAYFENYEIKKTVRNIYYVSSAHEYKNQLNVVQAFEIIFKENPAIVLHLIGDYDNVYGKKVFNYVNTIACRSNIFFHPTLDRSMLFELYKECDLYISASSCESFGINILDALRFKIPVACSNIKTYKELFDNHVVFFNYNSIESISKSLSLLINDFDLRSSLSEKGNKFSKNFEWDKSMKDLYFQLFI
jgi:glycosyltransferase involved in cell wall biosynthesis